MSYPRTQVVVDTTAFRQQARAHVAATVNPAIVDATNEAAKAGQKALVEALPKYLDRPTPFTLDSIGLLPATSDRADLAALIYIRSPQVQYMRYVIEGGTLGPGDYGATAEGPLVPGPDAVLDAYGNLPVHYVEMLEDSGAAWVTLKQGQPPALVQEIDGRLHIYALIVHELHYAPGRFPFIDLLTEAVNKAMPGAFGDALDRQAKR